MILQYIVIGVLTFSIILSIIFIVFDERRKRPIKEYPFISFLMPTYKDEEYLEEAIESLPKAYPEGKFEAILINDNSPDNTAQILAKMAKKYSWVTVLTNKTNIGKSVSVNNASKIAKGEVIFVLDTDTIIDKFAMEDLIGRLMRDERTGGVSCRYKVRNRKGFYAVMQDIEYSMLAFIQGSYNIFSTISLWGGCMAFKKKAFEQIGGLKPNFITEDMNSALELQELGWKVEQSSFPVYTNVPTKTKEWYKQKIRWGSGFTQCFLSHYKVYLRNPVAVMFACSYIFFAVMFFVGIVNKAIFTWYITGAVIDLIQALSIIKVAWFLGLLFFFYAIQKMFAALSYPIFSLPYLLYDDYYRKKWWRLFWIVPYTFIYFPMYSFVGIIAMGVGIKRFAALRRGERAW